MSEAGPTPETAPMPDLTGRVLGDFAVLRRLGQGGMGQVYLAEQQSLKRKVALKILKRELAGNLVSLQRFEAEAKAVARATHANIVQVYAFGDDGGGVHYMALEYVEGLNLREYLTKKGPPPLPLALGLMKQIAAALARAAELGIVHRDVKPDNILLTRKGEAKVTDFGLSRCFQNDPNAPGLTQSGVALGTPLYMSPEQVQGRLIDARADIYSFGATAYHLLSGQPPFRGETPFEVALKHVNEEPTPLRVLRPDLPPELETLVARMMAKKPEERIQTCREVLREINRLRERLSGTLKIPTVESSPPLPAATDVPEARAAVPRAGHRRVALVAASLLLAGTAGAAVGWVTHPEGGAKVGSLEEADPQPLLSPEEEFLKKQVALYLDPGKDPVLRQTGFQFALGLALLYLEGDRWAEAGELSERLLRNPQHVPTYEGLGRLGKAIALGFADRAADSNALVLEQLQVVGQGRSSGLLNNPRLRAQLARALERNRVNLEASGQPFPSELEPLCRPQHYAPGDTKKKEK